MQAEAENPMDVLMIPIFFNFVTCMRYKT
jgi:hypothetical protein